MDKASAKNEIRYLSSSHFPISIRVCSPGTALVERSVVPRSLRHYLLGLVPLTLFALLISVPVLTYLVFFWLVQLAGPSACRIIRHRRSGTPYLASCDIQFKCTLNCLREGSSSAMVLIVQGFSGVWVSAFLPTSD